MKKTKEDIKTKFYFTVDEKQVEKKSHWLIQIKKTNNYIRDIKN